VLDRAGDPATYRAIDRPFRASWGDAFVMADDYDRCWDVGNVTANQLEV